MALVDNIKNIAATIGVIIPLGGIYTAAGLPVPATTSQLENKIEPIRYGLNSLEIVVLQQQREILSSRRNNLRSDKFALLTLKKSKSPEEEQLNQGRIAQIEDSLKEVEGKDLAITKRIEELSTRPWQDKITAQQKK
jgi:hypothetical protein